MGSVHQPLLSTDQISVKSEKLCGQTTYIQTGGWTLRRDLLGRLENEYWMSTNRIWIQIFFELWKFKLHLASLMHIVIKMWDLPTRQHWVWLMDSPVSVQLDTYSRHETWRALTHTKKHLLHELDNINKSGSTAVYHMSSPTNNLPGWKDFTEFRRWQGRQLFVSDNFSIGATFQYSSPRSLTKLTDLYPFL